MAHAVAEHPDKTHMGLPLPNGKLAMWLFLITEIMFFTALIGTYIILRHGQPTQESPWPAPHDVHLIEWVGAFNTFVLICSSLTVVLAHLALHHGNTKRAVQYIGITLALGAVFLVVKAFEYKSKFEHGILPGRVNEKLDGHHGQRYVLKVQKELEDIASDKSHASDAAKLAAKELYDSLSKLTPKQVNAWVVGVDNKHIKIAPRDYPKEEGI